MCINSKLTYRKWESNAYLVSSLNGIILNKPGKYEYYRNSASFIQFGNIVSIYLKIAIRKVIELPDIGDVTIRVDDDTLNQVAGPYSIYPSYTCGGHDDCIRKIIVFDYMNDAKLFYARALLKNSNESIILSAPRFNSDTNTHDIYLPLGDHSGSNMIQLIFYGLFMIN